MDELQKAKLKKLQELKDFESGARGETRFGGIKKTLASPQELEIEQEKQRQADEMQQTGSTSYEAPIVDKFDIEKIKMMDPNYRAKKEAELQQVEQPMQQSSEPTQMEIERFANKEGLSPQFGKESDEQFMKRVKELMRRNQ